MAFSEKVKQEVKKRAAFRCCRCQCVGIQVHHIIPEEHDGKDTIENAAPLCANCHADFGDNPKKRKEITEMCDWWYKQVESHFFGPNPSIDMLEQINAKVEDIKANQTDLTELKGMLKSVVDEMIDSITPATAPMTASNIVNASSSVIANFVCPSCSTHVGIFVGNACPSCGEPLRQ